MSASEYDVYEVSSGEFWRPDLQDASNGSLGDGDVFENVLIDCRAENSAFKLNADGNGWVIRNVGVIGQPERNHADHHNHQCFNVEGDGLIENVFIDGRMQQPHDEPTKMGAFRLYGSHSGHIDMRNCFVAGFGNNGFYASSAGKKGGGGSIVWDSCFHRDNTPANFRPGTRGSGLRNCISIADDPECLHGVYYGGGGRGIRGIWANHCPGMFVENTTFYHAHGNRPCDANQECIEVRHFHKSDCGEAEIEVLGCHFAREDGGRYSTEGNASVDDKGGHTTNLDLSVLQNGGVPLNPEMAARGERMMPPTKDIPAGGLYDFSGDPNDGGGTDPTSRVSITNDGSAQTDYEFVVDGSVTRTDGFGPGDEVVDNGDGTVTASGFVNGGTDAFTYEGCIQDFSYNGPEPEIHRDGQSLTIPNIVDCEPPSCPEGETYDPDQGQCVPVDPCADVTCPDGEICVDGECVPDPNDPCADVTCPDGQTCENGECVSVCGPDEEWDPEVGDCVPKGDDGRAQAALTVLGLGVAAAAAREYLKNR